MGWPEQGWTLEELASRVGGVADGAVGAKYLRPVSASTPDPAGVAFAESKAYLEVARTSGVGALLVAPETPFDGPCVRVPNPRVAFLALLTAYGARREDASGVAPSAVVSPDATVGSGATIGPGCFVGPGCSVKSGTVLGPNVTLVQDVRIGENCRVHAGAVLGADGFGFAWDGTRHVKIPQVGGVVIGDDVEIGANCCIDRATCGDTMIGTGTKIDNLVQIGHNSILGRHVVVAGCTAIAGSVSIGDGVVIGGLTAVSDHVSICAGARIGGMSGVARDVTEPGDYSGHPLRPTIEHLRTQALTGRLRKLFDQVHELSQRTEDPGG